jgi:uncharacterized protein YdhG (YjbR/CyaY superfamily)
MNNLNDIDTYISAFPAEIQVILERLRVTIKKAAPEAVEVISYKMPAYKLNGILVWFAAHQKHIGFYPGARPIVVFEDELEAYKTSKGAIQFPVEKPLPLELITEIVKFRVNENMSKLNAKSKKK